MAKLFPFRHIHDFLSADLSDRILNYAAERQSDFRPSTTSANGMAMVSDHRISMTLNDLGPLKSEVAQHILAALPEVIDQLKISAFEVGEVELQLAAHGDGALFVTHIDTGVHEKKEKPRVISMVYYLHTRPKQFSGGNLRLHTLPIGEEEVEPVDISPDHNSLLAFPSFAPHEVLPIVAPGVEFKDWRFAVNCWVHKA
jgi:SM-20-related protein